MKRIFLALGILLSVLTLNAQKDFLYNVFTVDTLTDAETANFVFPYALEGLYEYEWMILTDSISGGTGGTAYLQTANDDYGEDYTNIASATHTITGAATQTGGFITGIAYGTLNRLSVVGTGTQSTKLTIAAAYKKLIGGSGGRYRDFYYYSFTVDSTDAAESIYFEFPYNLEGRYYYSWQVVSDENSGSATATSALQEGADNNGTLFYGLTGKTDAKTADGSALYEGTCYGTNQRLKLTQSTTGKWYYEVYVVYKKIK